MNPRASTTLFLFGLAAVPAAHATLVAGWDFSQFSQSGANSVNGTDFAGAGNAEANYSDFLSPSPDVGASAYGSIYYDGSFGSTDAMPAGFDATVAPATGDLLSAALQTGDGYPFNDSSSHNVLDVSGQAFTNALSLGIAANSSIVFEADLPDGETGSNWALTFAAKEFAAGDRSTITWEVSTDGTSYTALPASEDITTTDVDSPYTVDAGDLLDGANTVYFRAIVSELDTQLLIDNVGIHATLGSDLWGGYPVTEDGNVLWADTRSDWLGWITVQNEPIVYVWGFDTYIYLSEPAPDANGAWAYFFKKASESYTPVTGADTWGGYPTTTGGDGNTWADARLPGYEDPNPGTANWVGWMMVNKEPYINIYNASLPAPDGPVQVWVYMTEPAPDATGAWGYVFKRQGD